jgi:hypothetical protein
MKSLTLVFLFSFLTIISVAAQQTCMMAKNIKALDAKWEEANLLPDPYFMESVLAKEFVWVHNHASMTDNKMAVVARAKKQKSNGISDTKSRIQSEVKVAITGKNAIVTGITIVDRGPIPTRYHFMRTYVEVDGKCLLVGNHTMAIPEEE